jgi:hypothetical protein
VGVLCSEEGRVAAPEGCLRLQHAENCTAVVAEEHTSVFGTPAPAGMDAIASLIEEVLVARRGCLVSVEPMRGLVVAAWPLTIQQHRPT